MKKEEIKKRKEKNRKKLAYNKDMIPQNSEFYVELCHIDLRTGKRSQVVVKKKMKQFLTQLKYRPWLYCDVVNNCLVDNLDFSKMCMNVTPNVYEYLPKEHQNNPEIIQFRDCLIKAYKQKIQNNRVEKQIMKEEMQRREGKNCNNLAYNVDNIPNDWKFMVKLRHVDLLTGERSQRVIERSMIQFMRLLKDHSSIYRDVVNKSLVNNLDFSKMCININPNVYEYLPKEHQGNPEIIKFINGLRIADRKPINFLYHAGAQEKYGDIFKEYLENYQRESEQLRAKYGQEALEKIELQKQDKKENKKPVPSGNDRKSQATEVEMEDE